MSLAQYFTYQITGYHPFIRRILATGAKETQKSVASLLATQISNGGTAPALPSSSPPQHRGIPPWCAPWRHCPGSEPRGRTCLPPAARRHSPRRVSRTPAWLPPPQRRRLAPPRSQIPPPREIGQCYCSAGNAQWASAMLALVWLLPTTS